jgi:hypothetical protein
LSSFLHFLIVYLSSSFVIFQATEPGDKTDISGFSVWLSEEKWSICCCLFLVSSGLQVVAEHSLPFTLESLFAADCLQCAKQNN